MEEERFRDWITFIPDVQDLPALTALAGRHGGQWWGGGTRDGQTGAHYLFATKADRERFEQEPQP